METIVIVATGFAVALGLAGTVVTRLPGVPLIWSAMLVWAAVDNSRWSWAAAGAASVVALAAYVGRSLLAGRPLAEVVAPARSLVIGVVFGAVGLLLARTLGMVAGFVFGTYLAERRRLRSLPVADRRGDGRPTAAMIGVEVAAGLAVTALWLAAVVYSANTP